MEISNYLYINNYKPLNSVTSKKDVTEEKREYSSVPNLCPEYFSPSFKAMKKKEFTGIDRLVVEKYNAPIQEFNFREDFDAWAESRCEEIYNKDYQGKSDYIADIRKHDLRPWWEDICRADSDYGFYTPAQRLLIMDGITKDLGENNDTRPPTWNRDMMAQTMFKLMYEVESGKNVGDYNFGKAYTNHMKLCKWSEPTTDTNITGWVRIPSKENDPKNYKTNLIKLKALRQRCRVGTDKNELLKGDYHVYLEKGVPRLGIGLNGDKISNIEDIYVRARGDIGGIPFRYYDECCQYIKDNNLEISDSIRDYLKQRKSTINKYAPLKKKIKESNPEEIFNVLGIKSKKDKKGMLTISHFSRSKEMEEDSVTFDDLGINLGELLKNVKIINGDANLRNQTIKSLPNLEYIGGDAKFSHSIIDDLSKLKEIGGNCDFHRAKIKDMSGLEKICGYANFDSAIIGNLSGLIELPGGEEFQYAEIDDLSGLKTFKGGFHCTKIRDLSGLETIEDNAHFGYSEIEDLSGLKAIGKDAWCQGAIIGNMSGLTSIGGRALLKNTIIKGAGLPNLREIGESADFDGAHIPNIEELKERFKDKLKS